MQALQQLTGAYLYTGLFILTVASALFPWVNSEILILSASAEAGYATLMEKDVPAFNRANAARRIAIK